MKLLFATSSDFPATYIGLNWGRNHLNLRQMRGGRRTKNDSKELGGGVGKQFSSPIKSGWGLFYWVRDLVCISILALNSKDPYKWQKLNASRSGS
jgi:hypothetical protein